MDLKKEELLKRFRFIHGSRFQYNLENYKNANSRILINCPDHGDFEQLIAVHLRGGACPKCKSESLAAQFRQPRELVLDRFREQHGDKYDYTLVDYVNCKAKVDIICPDHGIFSQKVESHYRGNGCPKCAQKKVGEKNHFNRLKQYTDDPEKGDDSGLFYKLLFTHIPSGLKFIKIGITSDSIENRYKGYKDFHYEIIDVIRCSNRESAELEQAYKQANKDKRFFLPDHIKFAGRTECYEYDEKQQADAKQLKIIRDHLLKKQDNLCPICRREVNKPVVDHQHTKRVKGTGLIRGVLCSTCNTFLARMENNCKRHLISLDSLPDVLRYMADFFEKKHTNYIHPSEKPKPKKLGKRVFNKIAKRYREENPNRKPLEYPKSGKITKKIQDLAEKYDIEL